MTLRTSSVALLVAGSALVVSWPLTAVAQQQQVAQPHAMQAGQGGQGGQPNAQQMQQMAQLRQRAQMQMQQQTAAAHAATALTADHQHTGPSENAQVDESGEGNAEAEHESEGPPKPINFSDTSNKKQPPYIAALLNFLILAGIYWYFGRGPVSAGLLARRDSIKKQIEEAQRMKEEAQARAKEYQAKIANLDAELESTKAALIDAGKMERDRIVKEAEEKAARMMKDAQFLIDQEMKTTREELRKHTVDTAIAAAEELLKSRLTADDQTRLADEYLAELVTKNAKSARPTAGGAS